MGVDAVGVGDTKLIQAWWGLSRHCLKFVADDVISKHFKAVEHQDPILSTVQQKINDNQDYVCVLEGLFDRAYSMSSPANVLTRTQHQRDLRERNICVLSLLVVVMSGIEVVGLVLGCLPLLISGIHIQHIHSPRQN